MKPGLYEQIINKEISGELKQIPDDCKHQERVDSAEASRVFANVKQNLTLLGKHFLLRTVIRI